MTSTIAGDLWASLLGFGFALFAYSLAVTASGFSGGIIDAFRPGAATLGERLASMGIGVFGLIAAMGMPFFVGLAIATAMSLHQFLRRWSLTFVPAGGSSERIMTGAAAISIACALGLFDYRQPLLFGYGSLIATMLRGARWYLVLSAGVLAVLLVRTIRRDRHRLPPASALLPLDVEVRGDVRVAHWSDLHVTRDDAERTFEGKTLGGNRILRDLVNEQFETLRAAGVLLLTGDVTDRGLAEEWRAFFDIVPEPLLEKAFVIPGNHDLNLSDLAPTVLTEGTDRVPLSLRMIRFLAAADAIQGERVVVWRAGMTLRAYLQHFAADLKSFYAAPPNRCFASTGGKNPSPRDVTPEEDLRLLSLVPAVYAGAFPMVAELDAHRLALVLLDSNDRSANVLDNAFGLVPPDVLGSIAAIRRHYEEKRFGITYLLHHHVVLPEEAGTMMEKVQLRAMRLINAGEFLETIAAPRPVAVFHGHRHFGYSRRTAAGLQLLSAPSTTLGDEGRGTTNGCFATFDIAVDPDGGVVVGNERSHAVATRSHVDPLPFGKTPFAQTLRRGLGWGACVLLVLFAGAVAFRRPLARWAVCQEWMPDPAAVALVDTAAADASATHQMLIACASRGSLPCVRRLLGRLSDGDPSRIMAMGAAVGAEQVDVAAELYAAGVDLPGSLIEELRQESAARARLLAMRDRDGDTPLHRAIRAHDRDSAIALIAAGAPVYAKNRKGQTPADLASGDAALIALFPSRN